jgi:hypothetical protein
MNRRAYLTGLAGGATLLTAGCSLFQGSPGTLDFGIENTRAEAMTVRVEFIRPDVSDHSDALVYGEAFDLAPGEEVIRDAVATNQGYRIELELDESASDRTFTDRHFHYRPYQQTGDRLVQIHLYEDGIGVLP